MTDMNKYGQRMRRCINPIYRAAMGKGLVALTRAAETFESLRSEDALRDLNGAWAHCRRLHDKCPVSGHPSPRSMVRAA